jgi:pimeloyl-ACP methyl ester carboxylesterase
MRELSIIGKYIEIEPGIEIYCEEKGSGQAIVFVPGWTFTTEVVRNQLHSFTDTYRVVVIDPRSQGRSTVTTSGNDYAMHASDLAKVVEILGLRNVVLIGWSFGALTTWGYIKNCGIDNVKCHVCVDMSPLPLSVNADDWTEGELDEIADTISMLRTPRGQRDFITRYAKEIMVQRKLKPEEITWIVEQSAKSPPWAATLLFASGVFSNHMKEAKLLDEKRPSLFVITKHWADTAVRFIGKHFPNTKTAVLGGHMMFWEYPKKFNEILEGFIA